jgi:hypothetical protein
VPIFKLPVTAEEVPERKSTRKAMAIVLTAVGLIAISIALTIALKSKPKAAELGQSSASPPAPTTTKSSADFVDVIRTGGGIWKGRFGKLSAVVFADDPLIVPEHPFLGQLPNAAAPAELTVSNCLIERGARLVARAPDPAPHAVHTDQRIVGGLLTRDKMVLHLQMPDNTPRRLTLYFWDFKDAGRVQSITIRDPETGDVLATKTISGFREGHYVVFTVAGELLIEIKLEKGPNGLLEAMFLDPLQPTAAAATQADEGKARPTRRGAGAGSGRRR